MHPILLILLFGLLLLSLISPFAALAPLMLFLLVVVAIMFGWSLIWAFVTGETKEN